MTAAPAPPLLKRLPTGAWVLAFWLTVIGVRIIQRERELHHLVNLRGNMEDGPLLVTAIVTTLVGFLLYRAPLAAVAVSLAGVLATLGCSVFQTPIVLYLVADAVVGYTAVTRSRRVSVLALLMPVTTMAGYTLCLIVRDEPYGLAANAGIASTTLIAWLIGNTVHQTRAHEDALRSRATEQAVTDERLRIARELHDMVAHSIGIIAIQAGVGSRVMDTQPAETRNALEAIESTSRETLAGLRRLLGALRQSDPVAGPAPLDPAPGLADLDRLAARTKDAAGVRVEVRRRGERRQLPPTVELSAYRIVQEAVTNVVRHSGTRDCSVTVDYRERELAIEVVDLGCGGSGESGGSHGYGIVGMRERVSLLDGDFSAGPRAGGGFRVAARLPLAERPAEVGAAR